MPLVLDGTNGVSGVDGTASNPAIEGTDSNTGIFYPAADTVAIGTGGTEALRVNSSQQVGIGTTSILGNSVLNVAQGVVARNSGATLPYFQTYNSNAGTDLKTWRFGGNSSGALAFETVNDAYSSATGRMTLDASGNLGLGTTSPLAIGAGYSSMDVRGANGGGFYFGATGASNYSFCYATTSALDFGITANSPLRIYTNNTERARYTATGYIKVSPSGTYLNSVGDYHEVSWTVANSFFFYHGSTTAANNFGLEVRYRAIPNGTGNLFLQCSDNDGGTTRAQIRSNGGIANFSANNVNLSDRREKTNFAPAKNYLDVICAIPVQTFNYIDQAEDDPGLTLGVVAQDVEEVAPELVMESNWGSVEEPKMRLSVYQTDLQYALMKSIQELNAKVEAQAAEIAALKGNA